jgi:flagellar basal body-associated protein FliL
MAKKSKKQATKTKKIIILAVILLLLLIIAAIIYLLLTYFNVNQPSPQTNLNANTNQVAALPDQPLPDLTNFNNTNTTVLSDSQTLNGEVEEADQAEQVSVLLIAEAFAERFGSYSNQSNYANLDDLSVFMTESMTDWVNNTYKENLKQQNPDFNTYYAIETKAISKQVENLDEVAGEAEVIVKTQRQEFNNDINNSEVFYQDVLLEFVKVDDQWKVDGAYWQ